MDGDSVSALSTFTAPPQVDFDEDVATRREDADDDYSGWFCIETAPWPCPAEGCKFVAHHLTAAHLIVVWPANADPTLLANAANARELGRNPHVVEYEPDFGPCISWDEWTRLGRPVHGLAKKPDGWEGRPWRI